MASETIMTQDIVIERPLGPSENFYRCRNAAGFYQNFAAVGTYSIDLSSKDRVMFCALRKLILDYHILICNLFKNDADRNTILRPIAKATFGDLYVKVNGPTGGRRWYEKFIHDLCCEKLFDIYEELPLFRIVLAGESTLGATFEHTAADGVVAPQFHAIFLDNLSFCGNRSNEKEYEELYGKIPDVIGSDTLIFDAAKDTQFIKHSLPPPVEMFMENHLDYTFGDDEHYSIATPKNYPKKWPGRFPAKLKANKIMKLVHVGPEHFNPLLAACREKCVTLTAYLATIQALTLNPIYGDMHHTSCMIAVTLRRFLTPDVVEEPYKEIVANEKYRILGNFAHMGLPTLFEPVKEFSWDLVKKVNGELFQTTKNPRLLNTLKGFTDAADLYDESGELFSPILGANKADSVKMSNLGAYNFPVYEIEGENWTIDDLQFAQDMAPGASEFVVNVVSCPRGGLNIVLSYFEGDTGDEEALANIHRDFEENIKKYYAV